MNSQEDIIRGIKIDLSKIRQDIGINEWDEAVLLLKNIMRLTGGLSNTEFANILKQRIKTLIDVTELKSQIIFISKLDAVEKFVEIAKNLHGTNLLDIQIGL